MGDAFSVPFILSWYILWVVALLEACDITNNGRHLGFYQELKIRLKRREMVIFISSHEK